MNTQIIQLQETEGVGSGNNGTWQNTIPTDIFLEDGDEINIKQAFIETSNRINIVEPITATIKFTPYFINHDEGNVATSGLVLREYEKRINDPPVVELQPNNQLYMACDKHDPPGGGAQYELLKNYTLYGNYGVTVTEGDLFVIKFSYVDVSGKTITVTQHTDGLLKSEGFKTKSKEKHYDSIIPFNLLSVKDSFKDLTSSANNAELQVRKGIAPAHTFKQADKELIDADESYTPLELSQSVDIPAGQYEPNELAHLLTTGFNKINNDNVSQLKSLSITNPINNQLFTTTLQQNALSNTLKCKYVSSTGDDICNFVDGAPNRFMGAENFSIEYGDQNGIPKFLISNMHSPIFVNSSPGLKIQKPGLVGDQVNIIGVSNGILLTAMEPTSFWFDQLGFNQNCIYTPNHQKTTIAGVERITPTIGSNINVDDLITQQYCGLDFLIDKTITGNGADFLSGAGYNVPNAVSTPFVKSDEVIPIFAANGVSSTSINPYYLININCMKNDLKGNEVIKTLSCITGNYYNAGSYVLSQPADSVPYIHRGLPVSISNIGVSILSENGKSPVIGNKNHIFLELNKNPKNIIKSSKK